MVSTLEGGGRAEGEERENALGRLVTGFWELGGEGDGVVVGLDADGLGVDVALVLAAVLVDEVEGVAREDDLLARA